MNKIITKADANLISFMTSDVSEESILLNELLIKELVTSIQTNSQFISSEDKQILDNSNILQQQVTNVLSELEVSTLKEVTTLVEYLSNQIVANKQAAEISIQELKQNHLQELTRVNNDVQELKQEHGQQLAKVQAELELYKKKYHGQKNRKIVRFVDKVARV